MAKHYQTVLAEHQQRLSRLAERTGAQSLKVVYDSAQQELLNKLQRSVSRGLGSSYEAHQHRVLLGQIKQGQKHIADRMVGSLVTASKSAQVDSLRGLIADVNRLEMHFKGADIALPIDEASRFWGVIDKRKSSLLRMHEASMDAYGDRLVGRMEEQLGLSLATGENGHQAIDRLHEVVGGEWYQGERIARTEIAYAFNASHADGIEAASKEIPELMGRWCEHCDDETGAPLDDRVGKDSIAMHGQVAPAGGEFTMPDDPEVSASLRGQSWSFPPNRPNDRSVISPWRKDWGVPGWVLVGGRKQYL